MVTVEDLAHKSIFQSESEVKINHNIIEKARYLGAKHLHLMYATTSFWFEI